MGTPNGAHTRLFLSTPLRSTCYAVYDKSYNKHEDARVYGTKVRWFTPEEWRPEFFPMNELVELDFINSPEFTKHVESRIVKALSEANLSTNTASELTRSLIFRAKRNRRTLQERAQGTRRIRTEQDALQSVDLIMRTAIALAVQRETLLGRRRDIKGRPRRRTMLHKNVSVSTVVLSAAVKLKFCKIWPFCK